jgi:predicted hotdog family 3-hydroxylacyl-ACP dehydratase
VSTARLGRDWLAANLPHAGAMNLLDAIVDWDETRLTAIATSHTSGANPLRRGGELPIACVIEYAAQAAAAHGALIESRPSGPGMLVAARAVEFGAPRLDDAAPELRIVVEALGGGDSGVVYRFEVGAGASVLATGRITVAFQR